MYSTISNIPNYDNNNKNLIRRHKVDYVQPVTYTNNFVNPNLDQSKEPECLIWGALAVVLRICRWAGVAPLRLARMPNGWRASASAPFYVYSCLLVIGLHAATIAGLVLDYKIRADNEDDAVRVKTTASQMAWILELIFLLSIITIGVFSGPSRMKSTIECMNLINDVHIKLTKGNNWQPGERKKICTVILIVILENVIQVMDWTCFYSEIITHETSNRSTLVLCFYIAVNIETFMHFLLELQFVYFGLVIESAFKYVNRTMKDLIYVIDMQGKPKYKLVTGIWDTAVPIPYKSEFIAAIKTDENYEAREEQTQMIRETISLLSYAYLTTCDVLQKVNEAFGKLLTLCLGIFIVHLVITPYYYFSHLLSENPKTYNIIIQNFYLVWHLFVMVLATEPGHRTESEMTETQTLLGQLLRRIDPRDPLAVEFHNIYKTVTLNQAVFSPLGLTALTRPTILSIFGTVTTYIVILLQFQSLDNKS